MKSLENISIFVDGILISIHFIFQQEARFTFACQGLSDIHISSDVTLFGTSCTFVLDVLTSLYSLVRLNIEYHPYDIRLRLTAWLQSCLDGTHFASN